MLLHYETLAARGVETRQRDDGLELIPQMNWSKQAQTNFRDFCLGIGLTEAESDELADYANRIAVTGAIKKSLRY